MLMVLTVHIDGASLGLPEPFGNLAGMSARDWWRLAVESVAIIGVNCFTLISGYFGIRLSAKGCVRYLGECVFYSVAIFLFACSVRFEPFSVGGLVDSVRVLTRTDLWYVPAYFILMLFAPVLNGGAESLGKRRFALLLGALTGVTVWCGWWCEGKFNPTGYTPLQLIYVYLIGRFIRLHSVEPRGGSERLQWLSLWAIAVAGILFTALHLSTAKGFAYNSPAVLLSTVCLFMAFRSMRFSSGVVNFFARGAFAVYLIHKAPAIWVHVMRPVTVNLWRSMSLAEFTLVAGGMAVGIYVVCALIDAVRRFAFRE